MLIYLVKLQAQIKALTWNLHPDSKTQVDSVESNLVGFQCGVTEDKEWAGKEFDTAAVQEAVEEKPEELSEGEPLGINDEHTSGEVMPAKTLYIKLRDTSWPWKEKG